MTRSFTDIIIYLPPVSQVDCLIWAFSWPLYLAPGEGGASLVSASWGVFFSNKLRFHRSGCREYFSIWDIPFCFFHVWVYFVYTCAWNKGLVSRLHPLYFQWINSVQGIFGFGCKYGKHSRFSIVNDDSGMHFRAACLRECRGISMSISMSITEPLYFVRDVYAATYM